jgi:hypothetical protein
MDSAITKNFEKMGHFVPMRECDFRQEAGEFPEKPSHSAHSAGVLAALVGFYRREKSSRGQVKPENGLFGVKTRQTT